MNSIVIGLGFGDEGKGSIIDYLTRRDSAKLVVRFNGGPQAAHHVVVDGGPTHCFSQWGSGTLAGADTLLSRFMLVSIGALVEEEAALVKAGVVFPACKLFIDRDAIVITPFQVALNQIRELSRTSRHGSCGRGVGEAVSDDINHPEVTIRVKDLDDLIGLSRKLRRNQAYKIQQFVDEVRGSAPSPNIGDRNVTPFLETLYESKNAYAEIMHDAFRKLRDRGLRVVDRSWLDYYEQPIIFEGAQGVLLDQDFGFHPHTTWSKTTFVNAEQLIGEANLHPVQKIGVLRTFHTRHGTGPFPTYDSALSAPAGEHNTFGRWQGLFRCGVFDAALARYALSVVSPHCNVALTHCDVVDNPRSIIRVSPGYRESIDLLPGDLDHQERLGHALMNATPHIIRLIPGGEQFIDWLSGVIPAPISISSWGPTAEDKKNVREYAQ